MKQGLKINYASKQWLAACLLLCVATPIWAADPFPEIELGQDFTLPHPLELVKKCRSWSEVSDDVGLIVTGAATGSNGLKYQNTERTEGKSAEQKKMPAQTWVGTIKFNGGLGLMAIISDDGCTVSVRERVLPEKEYEKIIKKCGIGQSLTAKAFETLPFAFKPNIVYDVKVEYSQTQYIPKDGQFDIDGATLYACLLPVEIEPDESMFDDSTTPLPITLAGNGGSGSTASSDTGASGAATTSTPGATSGSVEVQTGPVRGDLIESINTTSGEKHFVGPKKTDEIEYDYVILRAKGVTADQITPGANQILEWHVNNSSYGQVDSSNPLKFNVKRDAAKHAIVSIGPKNGNAQSDKIKMHVWIVWSSVTPTLGTANFNQIASAGAKWEIGKTATTGWRFKYKIEPADICDPANTERPNLTGASRKPVPGKGKTYPLDTSKDGDSANKKWDVTRQAKWTVRNPGGIPKADLMQPGQAAAWFVNQPKAVDSPVNFPTNANEGNDDPDIADEDDDPYNAKSGGADGLDHQVGELSSVDAPGLSVLNSWGAAGRTFAKEFNFKELTRLELWDGKRTSGRFWFRISDYYDWHHYLETSYDVPTTQWKDASSSSGARHPTP